jgi:hypothetical protein
MIFRFNLGNEMKGERLGAFPFFIPAFSPAVRSFPAAFAILFSGR